MKNSTVNSFVRRLKELRASKDLTQIELTKQIKINPSLYNAFEKGHRVPSFEQLKIISKFYGIPLLSICLNEQVKKVIIQSKIKDGKVVDDIFDFIKDLV
jgi:transcriptional regulator with XRE-family HTH domain